MRETRGAARRGNRANPRGAGGKKNAIAKKKKTLLNGTGYRNQVRAWEPQFNIQHTINIRAHDTHLQDIERRRGLISYDIRVGSLLLLRRDQSEEARPPPAISFPPRGSSLQHGWLIAVLHRHRMRHRLEHLSPFREALLEHLLPLGTRTQLPCELL